MVQDGAFADSARLREILAFLRQKNSRGGREHANASQIVSAKQGDAWALNALGLIGLE